MVLAWDYSSLAATYDKRPGYAPAALDRLAATVGLGLGTPVADIGAGTGKLTLPLMQRGCHVVPVEPNACMRRIGMQNTASHALTWLDAMAEATDLPGASFQAVIFGSSFNVVDRPRALAEAARILKPEGWFACLWNHRWLEDPVQAQVEAIIREMVPSFQYGSRREDQCSVIARSGLFGSVELIEERFTYEFAVSDYVDAWRSHATLVRQSGPRFEAVIEAIGVLLAGKAMLTVPYITRAWCAPLLPLRNR
jgi:ubiquinone/menaquinone biosynthesis C-methylase UbiE